MPSSFLGGSTVEKIDRAAQIINQSCPPCDTCSTLLAYHNLKKTRLCSFPIRYTACSANKQVCMAVEKAGPTKLKYFAPRDPIKSSPKMKHELRTCYDQEVVIETGVSQHFTPVHQGQAMLAVPAVTTEHHGTALPHASRSPSQL